MVSVGKKRRWRRATGELRDKLNLSQEELARKLSVSAKSVFNWESGNASPSKKAQRALRHLARAAGLPDNWP